MSHIFKYEIKLNNPSIFLFHIVILAIITAPLVSVDVPVLFDYLNHLARWHVLNNFDSLEAVRQNYMPHATIAPYLFVDAIAVPLTKVVGVYKAGQIVVVWIWCLIYVGVLVLHKVIFGHIGLWPGVAAIFLYNHAQAWGFLNFGLATAIFFFALAGWLLARSAPWTIRFVLFSSFVSILYFSHMLMLGAFSLIVAVELAWRILKNGADRSYVFRELSIIAIPTILSALFFMGWFTSISYDETIFNGWTDTSYRWDKKLRMIFSPIYFMDKIYDTVFFGIFAATYIIYRRCGDNFVRIHDSMRWALVAFCGAVVAMPLQLFGVWLMDIRLPAVLLMFLVAVSVPIGTRSKSLSAVGGIAILLLVLARAASVWPTLDRADARVAELQAEIGAIDHGSKVLVAMSDTSPDSQLLEYSFWHMAHLVVIERDAFTPFLFTWVTQIRPTDATAKLDTISGFPLSPDALELGLTSEFAALYDGQLVDRAHRVYWANWPDKFDFLIVFSTEALPEAVLEHVEKVGGGSFFTLYRII